MLESWQAHHWLHELDPSLLTPMIRIHAQDFFVFEPAQLKNGEVVIPDQWFTRRVDGADKLYAVVNTLTPAPISEHAALYGYIVN